MNTGLQERDLRTIHAIFAKYPDIRRVALFGSRAKGNYTPGSDIDLAVMNDGVTTDLIARLHGEFEESSLPYFVDLVNYPTLTHHALKDHIDRVGVELYHKAPATTWKTYRIEDLAEKVGMGPFGSSIKVETFVPNGIPVISGVHLKGNRLEDIEYNFVTEEHANRLFNANVYRGDVIFTHAGNIGAVAYIPNNSRYERYILSQRQFYLRCNTSKLLPEFITYYFKSPIGKKKLLANTSSVGVPSIAQPVSYLRSIEIDIPDINEQHAIAEILSAFDDKIELNRQMNQTLEAIAQAMFKEWFVKFNFPGCDGQLVDGLPQGWRVGKLGDLISLSKDTISPSNYPEKEFYHYSIPAFDSGKNPTKEFGKTILSNKFVVKKNSILISKLNPRFPRLWAIENIDEDKAICSTEFLVLQPISTIYYSYCLCFLHLKSTLDIMTGLASGTSSSHQRIKPDDIISLSMTIPSASMLNEFENTVIPLFNRQTEIIHENQTLTAIRDSLLPKLMTGKISPNTIIGLQD